MAGFGLAAPNLVGRDRELTQASRWLSAAEGGSGGLVILQGDVGIGKTRLVNEIVGVATARGMVVRACEAVQSDQTRPFGAISDALEVSARSADPALAELARRIEGHQVWTGHLEDVPMEVHSLIEALIGVFESLCTTAPLLMVIDNLHWADSSSLAMLRRLTRLSRQYPALVLASTRPTDKQAVLALLDAVSQDGGTLVKPGPLDTKSVLVLAGQLAGGPPGPRLADRLAQASGYPLFVVELLTTLVQQGHISITPAGQAEIDASGAAASLGVSILHRLSLLPADSIELLRAAAICGRTVDVAEVSMLTGRDTLALARSLRTAERAGIIETRDDKLWFRHELIHDALYRDWPLPVRRALHRELGQPLAAAGAPAWQVAHHLSLGAVAGDVDSAGWLHRAGLEAAPRDPAAAVTLLTRAAELAPPETVIRDVIRTDLSVALAWAGLVGDSERLATAVVAETLDVVVRGRAASWLAFSVLVRGRPHGSRELCRRARASGVGSQNVEILLCLLEEIASIAVGDRGGALDRMRQLLAPATALGDDALRSVCLGGLALAEANGGNLDAAAAYGAAAVRAAESAKTLQAFMINSHVMYAWILEEQDRLAEGLETVERLRKVAGGRFETPTVAQIERWRARAHFAAGRWDEALVDLDSALTVYGTGADVWPEPIALRALIAVHRGEPGGARADLDRYDAAIAAGGPVLVVDQPVLARAFLFEAEGQATRAARILAAGWEAAEAAPLAMAKPAIGPHLARLAVEAGDLATAHRVRSALDVIAAANPAVARLQAAARWTAGIAKADSAILVEAVHLQQDAGRPFDVAMVQEDTAAALAKDGHPDAARDLLNQALTCYEHLLARQRSAAARARLRALGVQVGTTGRRRRPATGWEALTAAELRVARLVADRLSNTEIAEHLFVSRRTVETHVTHGLAKLGFTSRRELITAVRDRQAAQDP